MKQILFDSNFRNNRFSEQIQTCLFSACKYTAPDVSFIGVTSGKVREEFEDNARLYRVPFGKFDDLWSNIVPPICTFLKKEVPFYFPCGNIPGFLPDTTPVITMLSDVLPLGSDEYFGNENEEKEYKRKIQTDMNRADLIFVPSNNVKAKLAKDFLLLTEPVVLPYASIISEKYIHLPIARSNERYFFLEAENVSHKGLNEILKIFIYSHMKGDRSLKLYISGNLKSSFKELMINLQVAKKVNAVREYKNLTSGQRATLMRGAIAAILPANKDSLLISHFDAMRCSCPVITSNLSEVYDVCEDSVIYANIDETDTFMKILKYLMENEPYRQELIAKALAREQYYTWDKASRIFIDKINSIYECENE